MIEVKNYRSVVPITEVEKFQRDVSVMPNIHAAMMISLGSPIAGHNSLDISDLAHGRAIPTLYLNSESPDIILASAKLLHLHVDQFRSIRNYLDQYNEHLYPKIWKGATKAMSLLQGIAQTRIMLLDLRTQMCQKIDKIQERILVNEAQLTDVLGKIRQRVSEFVPDTLSGGRQIKAAELWNCIDEMIELHLAGSAYHQFEANATMSKARILINAKPPIGNLSVQLHGRVLMVSQGSPIFRMKLMIDSTELGFIPVLVDGCVRLSGMQTYDGNWVSERIGRKGNTLYPRSHSSKPLTAETTWKPGDLVEDMLPNEMNAD
jgi:hypothetical protein